MTDNAYAYTPRHAFKTGLARLGPRQLTTRPYTPRTNGKAERFIQTALREWLYARAYPSSNHRTADMNSWLHYYNHRSLTVDAIVRFQSSGQFRVPCMTPRISTTSPLTR